MTYVLVGTACGILLGWSICALFANSKRDAALGQAYWRDFVDAERRNKI